MSTLKKLASQTAVYGLSTIVGRLLNYLLVPIHTRVFDRAEYGVVTEMYAYVSFFIVVLTYGMETAFFRFAQHEENKGKVFATALRSISISSVLFMVIMSLLSPQVAGLIGHADHPEYITYFAVILGLDAIASIPFALLRQQSKPLRFAVIKNINIFSNILLNLYFLLLCPYMLREQHQLLPFYSPGIGVGYVFISNLVASIITIPLLYREIWQIRDGFDRRLWWQMLAYGLPLLVVGLGGMINETLDRAIMKYLLPAGSNVMAELGVYGANYKLSILMSLFIQAFRFAAEPFFFSHAKTDDKKSIYAEVMDYFVLVCLFIFLLVTLYIGLFKHFVAPEYYEGLNVVPVLLLANMFLGIYYNLSIWYKLSDQTNKGAAISLTGAGITILLNVLWVPVYGYTGSAWATFFCYLGMMMICYFAGRRYYPIPYHTGRILLYMGLALLLFLAGRLASGYVSSTLNYVISTVLMGVFAATAWVFERRNKILTSPHSQ